jgi:hypothetical protein
MKHISGNSPALMRQEAFRLISKQALYVLDHTSSSANPTRQRSKNQFYFLVRARVND